MNAFISISKWNIPGSISQLFGAVPRGFLSAPALAPTKWGVTPPALAPYNFLPVLPQVPAPCKKSQLPAPAPQHWIGILDTLTFWWGTIIILHFGGTNNIFVGCNATAKHGFTIIVKTEKSRKEAKNLYQNEGKED